MKILGIEFGTWSLKAVEVESRFRRLEVLETHEVRLPLETLDPLATYKEAVQKLLSQLPAHPEKTVCALPSAQTAFRFSKLPIKQRKKAEQMFRFELEDNVPFKLPECCVDHQITKIPGGSMAFAAIAPKKHVQAHLQWLKATGIDPDWLTFEGMGLINLYLQTAEALEQQRRKNGEEEMGPTLLMDVGHRSTRLAFIHEGTLEYFRSVPWGGFSVTQHLSSALNISLQDAENFKISKFQLTRDDNTNIFLAATKSFETLLTDTQHCFASYRSMYEKDIESIVVTGGTSRTKGFVEFMSRNLGRPVERYDTLPGLTFAKNVDRENRTRFAEAIGRALVFTRKAAFLFNFRKSDLGKETSIVAVAHFFENPNIVKLSRYAIALLVMLFVYLFAATPATEKDASARTNALLKVFTQLFPDQPKKTGRILIKDPERLERFLKKRERLIQEKLKMTSKNRLSMINLMLSFSDAFPPDTKIDVNSLEISDGQFELKGVKYEGDLNQVTAAIRRLPDVSTVTLTEAGNRFTFKGQLKSARN